MMKWSKSLSLAVLIFFVSASVYGQNNLSKSISLDINRQRLDQVLEILSNKGDFYFSYSSGIVKKDSLVSFSVQARTVRDILNLLFNNTYEFRESGNYIIIRKAPIRMTLVTNKATEEEKVYSVSGFVYDEESGVAINQASVYEKKLLASALTNDQGYFKLRLKSGKASAATLTISKEFYEDTSIVIQPRHKQELTITMMPVEREIDKIIIAPGDYLLPDSSKTEVIADTSTMSPATSPDSIIVERTAMGNFLLSAKQKIQSINLRKFFTTRPFQFSLVPSLSSQGKMSGQVINNFSLNVLGGYTGGTNGMEFGGLFNIDKKDVRYIQAAGLFNIVGGKVEGFQAAGINNTVLHATKGFQVAGVYNLVTDSVKGLQVAGVANFASKKVTGVQIAGVINFSNRETNGVQIAGVF